MAKAKLIFAKNHKQATYWVRQLGWDQRECNYVSSAEVFQGRPLGTELHLVGRWWERRIDVQMEREINDRFQTGQLIQVEHHSESGVVLDMASPGKL